MPDSGQRIERIRDQCRRLKPVIGAQADRIWLGYVAENESGRRQIEEYLELLTAQSFHGSLESPGPGLIPPSAADAVGGYALGAVLYNNRELHPFGLRESEWTQHVGVFGRSGAGKTNLGFLIVQELVRAGKPVLVFDWKRSYRDLLPLPGFDNAAVYTIGRPVSPLSFNPLIPPPQTDPKTWLKKMIGIIAHAYLLGDGVMYLLQEAIDRAYEQAGVYRGSVDRWPSFRNVLDALKQRQSSGREAGWLSSALRALGSLCFGEMDVLLNQGGDDVGSLLDRTVILELDALSQSDKVFVAEAILLYIHHLRLASGVREQLQNVIVLEEAHHLLSDQRRSLVGGQSQMEITFREIRELNVGMVILDQHPSQINVAALGNLYCAIVFNLIHRTDVSAMNSAMLLQDEEKDLLGELQVGEAIVRLQGRSVKPFMIRVPEFNITKGAFTDTMVARHMMRLGLSTRRDHDAVRTSAVEPSRGMTGQRDTGAESTATTVIKDAAGLGGDARFLHDVAEFPDSGIADRYHRLGLSVRQGQKLKQRLIDRGLILEELKVTQRGKFRAIRLTEQGLQIGGPIV